MLDRTIPFYNTILKCTDYAPRAVVLPDGFSVVPYRAGDEDAWARMETAIGDFDSFEAARDYFIRTYLPDPGKLNDILFATDQDGRAVGSCIAWQDARCGKQVASLHWLVVDEAYQGMGLGRALCTAVMNRFAESHQSPVYIHTQPWSWKAILLYISMGFRLQQTDSFSDYENQYAPALQTLRGVLSDAQYALAAASAEP